ncbi:PPE domain-containing protein, partial [Pseudonocardia hispaniensis]
MTNPLIVAPENENAEPANWEGAGLFSSVADLSAGLTGGDAQLAGFSAVGAGLDALGMVMNPLGSLLEAGVGWLIEHVGFLHEPLDALAGDPTQIKAQARTWHTVAGELRAVGMRYRDDVGELREWEGAAADAYRAAARSYSTALRNIGTQADRLAEQI